MTLALQQIAMMAAMALPAGDGVPSTIHLLPAGPTLLTGDARGPYRLDDAEAVIAASFAERDRIEIDVNHATYLAAPRGGEAPAVGWITAMHARDDGIWGDVEWTEAGRALVAGRAYRGISPVLRHEAKTKRVTAILNASLVNRPNLKGLVTLHMETPMNWLYELLGLPEGATEEELRAAVAARVEARAPAMQAEVVALQAQVAEIGTALGLPEGADPAALVAAAQAAVASAAQPAELVALQSEIAALTMQLNGVTDERRREKATAFVDGAIAKGHVGVKPMRDRYVTMHMADPAGTEELVGAMPILGRSGTSILPPAAQAGGITLNAEQVATARMLGIPQDKYRARLEAEAQRREEIA